MSASVTKLRDARNKKNNRIRRKNAAQKAGRHKPGFVALIAFAVICILILAGIWECMDSIGKKNKIVEERIDEYNRLRIINENLEDKLNAPVDDEYIKDVAREDGLRMPNEHMYHIDDNN